MTESTDSVFMPLYKPKRKNHIKTATATILRPVPNKKPLNAPKAAFRHLLKSEESFISSPTKAPQKGPKIIPQGPMNMPTTRPIVEPQVPALEPPLFFVIATGKILSATETKIAATAQMIKITGFIIT